MPADILTICQRHAALKADRATWDSLCQELADVIAPRKGEITSKNTQPTNHREKRARNTTAAMCNMTLAQGCMAYAVPFSERWFVGEPPSNGVGDDEAFEWYAKCSEIMLEGIAASNLYTELHEACLDRSGFAVGNLYCEESLTLPGGIVFDAVPVGSFSIAENAQKMVDTVYRDREMTAVQLADEFGKDALPKKVLEALDNDSQRYYQKFTVVHAVYPRNDYDGQKLDSGNMPFASCWFLPNEKHLLREGGYETNPYLVSRYLKWGSSAYGWCPGWQALDPAKYLNRIEYLMDEMAEIQLLPRMLIPSSLEGAVGMGAGEVTVVNPFQAAKPQTWGTEGRIEAGLERMQRREQEIKDAYHYDLFKMFSSYDGPQMTRAEVVERSAEKLILFSPTFLRMQNEWLEPLIQRVFRIYMKQRRFPPPPQSVIENDGGGAHIRPPKIQFISRVSLAIRSLQSSGFMNLLEALQPMMAVDPTVRHVVQIAVAAKGLGRNFGVPEEWMSTVDQYMAAIQAEQEAAAQQQQMENANNMLSTAAKLKPEQIQGVMKQMGGVK